MSHTVNGNGTRPPLSLYLPFDVLEELADLRRELRAVRRALRRLVPPPARKAAAKIGDGLVLRQLHRNLLGAATFIPYSAKKLAREAGYAKLNSRHRLALTELVRAGLLLHTPDGYKLPERKETPGGHD